LIAQCATGAVPAAMYDGFDDADRVLLQKVVSLRSLLHAIARNNQTHVLAYYLTELAAHFHNYYAHQRIINHDDEGTTARRVVMVALVRHVLGMCLDLLKLDKPQKM